MVTRILLVDDEENILHGYHRVLRHAFELDVALGDSRKHTTGLVAPQQAGNQEVGVNDRSHAGGAVPSPHQSRPESPRPAWARQGGSAAP